MVGVNGGDKYLDYVENFYKFKGAKGGAGPFSKPSLGMNNDEREYSGSPVARGVHHEP
jgi:hypothetical protein